MSAVASVRGSISVMLKITLNACESLFEPVASIPVTVENWLSTINPATPARKPVITE